MCITIWYFIRQLGRCLSGHLRLGHTIHRVDVRKEIEHSEEEDFVALMQAVGMFFSLWSKQVGEVIICILRSLLPRCCRRRPNKGRNLSQNSSQSHFQGLDIEMHQMIWYSRLICVVAMNRGIYEPCRGAHKAKPCRTPCKMQHRGPLGIQRLPRAKHKPKANTHTCCFRSSSGLDRLTPQP